MTHTLEADSIQLEFDGRNILSDIYINCHTGKISGLLGRNGAGKSCLMKIIYGILKCEKSIRVDNLAEYEAYKKPHLVVYLPQFNFIPKFLTIKRIFHDFELDFYLFEKRFPEFSSKYKRSLSYLSNGERRLAELYVILKSRSYFAMLDEPFTHFNPIQIDKVKELLVEEKVNKGLLITDHLFKHILDISDNLFILNNGKTYLTKSEDDIETLGYARSSRR